ncbi:unnamed protein product [Angiostrongylus costaricensis]|uniref:CUB domain-containing protein n=1 Tax=Angiostrongylus costaricensis TaxID=334426 RepID=A0A3P7HVI1_ANGCS|nr:unnamed protein product [Angiostrongylus costaricensis]
MQPSGCGKILTATNSYRALEDVVGERGLLHGKDEFKMCNYWIKGPVGSKIEVVFVSYTDRVATDGCRFAGVEIKAGSDKRLTGYR